MRLSSRSHAPLPGLALASLFALLLLEGCGTTPASAPAASTELANPSSSELALLSPGKGMIDPLWPNDDGRFWQYRLAEAWTPVTLDFYDQAANVPPAPSVWDLAAKLRAEARAQHGSFTGGPAETATWTLRFDGRITTESGAEGQNLTELLLNDPLAGARATSSQQGVVSGMTGPAFWSHLAAARPDLAPAVRKRLGLGAQATLAVDAGPILLHGGAWEKTAEHIGTYGDLSHEIAWLYLVANVLPGSTFDLQLVPELASDVWLHALVLPRRLASRPRPAPGAVEVLYLIDYGVSQATDVNGSNLGAMRSIEYGTVTYVPGVGPVAAFERALFPGPGRPPEGVKIETWSRLSSTGPGTWYFANRH
jgi:hypothetical protein